MNISTFDSLLEKILKSRKSKKMMCEGRERLRRQKLSLTKARTRTEKLRSQQSDPGFLSSIVNLFRRGEEKRTLDQDLASSEAKVASLPSDINRSQAKIDRSIVNRYKRKDVSTEANRLKSLMGLRKSIASHETALQTETNPEKVQFLQRKVEKAKQRISRV